MRQLAPDVTLRYFTTVQRAFYAEGRDVTDFGVLVGIAANSLDDVSAFASLLATPEARKAAWADFARARKWGITGFPTLVGDLGDGRLALLASGWTPADVIRRRIASIDSAATG
jgi:putative protein-disulfide isomerase